MKRIIFLTFFILTHSPVKSQELSGIVGAFADIGYGARPMALAGGYAALADDIHSILWNPAGLSRLKSQEATFSFADQFGLISYHFLAVGSSIGKNQGIGAAVTYSGDEELQELTLYTSYSYLLGSQTRYPYTRLGASIKVRHAGFGNNPLNPDDYPLFTEEEVQDAEQYKSSGNANGFGLDFGIIWQSTRAFSIGLFVKDAIAPMKWTSSTNGNYDESVPMEIIIGTAYRSNNDLSVVLDWGKNPMVDEIPVQTRIGIEKRWLNLFLLRGGYSQLLREEIDRRYTFGVGFDWRHKKEIGVSSDLTYVVTDIANTARASLSIRF